MLDGMKMASQGMLAMTAKQDIIANNLANINTAGFQASTALTKSFDEQLMSQMQAEGFEAVGGINDGVPVIGVKTASKFQHGSLKPTGKDTDISVGGNGLFTIQNSKGETLYTRNGSFAVDQSGYLVTNQGDKVMGFNGPVRIPPGKSFVVDERGIVTVEGQEMARLRVTEFNDINELYTVGNSYYRPKNPTNVGQISTNPNIKQGFIETSNVNIIGEMVKMMEVEKAYEANQKVLHSEDDILKKAITEVGRVG